ncbi:MAG: tripartite tricarboxylate transporter substrate-binding protein, partial [Xanthobacteraceae bacterium]
MKRLLAAAALVALGTMGAHAQSFPNRPVTVLVPLAPGGSTDTIGRIMAEGIRHHLGQPVIVENAPGAGGSTGVIRTARSTPDGYLMQIGQWGTNVASGAVYDLPINLLTDLEPVALIATQPSMIVGRKDLPANNLKELIAYIKENPGKVTAGNAGIGSPGHVSSLFFQNTIGGKITTVQYRSAGPASQDLLAGTIDFMMDTASTSGGHVREGRLKAFAMTADKRSPVVPDVPTTDEAGLPGFRFYFWHAFWVPKGTPKDVIDKLNAAAVTALADPSIRQRLIDIGQQITLREQQTPAALAAYQKSEIERWWPV